MRARPHFVTQPLESYGGRVPFIVSDLVSTLVEQKAEQVEGIFRLSGSATVISNLMDELDRGPVSDYSSYNAITVACALKTYFRELAKTEPLISFSLYEPLLEAVSGENDSECIPRIIKVVTKLDHCRLVTLAFLMRYLSRIAQNSERNKMTPNNLAICFAPNLLGGQDASQAMMMIRNQVQNRAVKLMIEFADQIFASVPINENSFMSEREIDVLMRSALNEGQIDQMSKRWTERCRSLIPYAPKESFADPDFKRP